MDKRLALAALRLAALLEDVFGTSLRQPASAPNSGKTTVATRNVNLRPDPSTTLSPLKLVNKGDMLKLLAIAPVAGFYHVQTADGTQGWVYGRYIKAKSK